MFGQVFGSDASLESGEHGRQRRRERGITRGEMEECKQKGVREPILRGNEQRWKFTFQGICVITDFYQRHEITCWRTTKKVEEIRGRLNIGAIGRMTSSQAHFIVIVDSSGSMRNPDVAGFSSRLQAVNTCIVRDLVNRLHTCGMAGKSLLSLIEMRREAQLVFKGVPASDPYMISLLMARTEPDVADSAAYSHGNYWPALYAAQQILYEEQTSDRQVFLVFMSDSAPSDQHLNPRQFRDSCRHIMEDMAKSIEGRLSLATIGFGHPHADYSVLQAMAEAMPRGRSSFQLLGLQVNRLSSALSSLISNVSSWIELGTNAMEVGKPLILRNLPPAHEVKPCNNGLFISSQDWDIYPMEYNDPLTRRTCEACLRYDAHRDEVCQTDMSVVDMGKALLLLDEIDVKTVRNHFFHHGLVKEKKSLAQGSERVVFRASEVLSCDEGEYQHHSVKIGPHLVIKETKFENFLADREYHKRFLRIQAHADRVSRQFNNRLQTMMRPSRDGPAWPDVIPRPEIMVSFLDLRVFIVQDPNYQPHGVAEYLVEPELEGEYVKWNDNRGQVISSQATRQSQHMGVIAEEDEFVEESSDYESIPQALSHYSFHKSGGRSILVDLQGTWNQVDGYTLTDPAIHSISKEYGATDKGQAGIASFFESHRCCRWCRMLEI